jgi:hypothetical protein
VALSQLLMRAGDGAAALQALEPAIAAGAIDDVDPLWTYYASAGRSVQTLMPRLYEEFAR